MTFVNRKAVCILEEIVMVYRYDVNGETEYKLFCDLTMEFYWIKGNSLIDARRNLARKLNCNLDRIIECDY